MEPWRQKNQAYKPSGTSGRSLSRFPQHEVFLLPSPPPPKDGMLVHHRVTPSIKFSGTHFYTWVARGTVRVKCLVKEHNAVPRARARAARSVLQSTDHYSAARSFLLVASNGQEWMEETGLYLMAFSSPEPLAPLSRLGLGHENKWLENTWYDWIESKKGNPIKTSVRKCVRLKGWYDWTG